MRHKERVERLERERSASDALIVCVTNYAVPAGGFTGIEVNGEFMPCAPGESVDDLEKRLVAGIEQERRSGWITLWRT